MRGAATHNGAGSIAYVIDPRFAGGTSAAVAEELRAVATTQARIEVACIASGMFRGREIAPVLADALDDCGLVPVWDPEVIAAERVILHNPAFLKFDTAVAPRIVARELIVVTHENPLRPTGEQAFDLAHCLALIDRASLAAGKWLAPISAHNRDTLRRWLDRPGGAWGWRLSARDWFNICNFEMRPPARRPADRRGRHSRAGYEKFPPLADMDACFPAAAKASVILGADTFLADGTARPHWRALAFGAMPVAAFMGEIDFHVYFTAPTWRESFGRVLAEAIAAGKVVITDPETARTFGGAVVAARPAEVDAAIARFCADPARYHAQVRRAQDRLAAFSRDRFLAMFRDDLAKAPGAERGAAA